MDAPDIIYLLRITASGLCDRFKYTRYVAMVG